MTSEPPPSDSDGPGGGASHDGHSPGAIAPVRAAVVIIIFVVAAIALVAVGTRPTVNGGAATTPTTTPTTGNTTTTTTAPTTTTTIPNSAVKVVVANATETNGLAAHYTAVLAAQGWAMQTPADASATVQTSAVYYASAAYQTAATSIATTLGLKPAAVLPLSSSVPVASITGDDVVVVIGADLVAGA